MKLGQPGVLKGELEGRGNIAERPPSLCDSPSSSSVLSVTLAEADANATLMILSSKKLPELWDYFLIYVTGALEFNPDCKDIDLGLFPLRMNPTIKPW